MGEGVKNAKSLRTSCVDGPFVCRPAEDVELAPGAPASVFAPSSEGFLMAGFILDRIIAITY